MFSYMCSDRQDVEKELMQLRKENVILETSLNNKTNENGEIWKEVISRSVQDISVSV